jgi:protein involved in polysaccharide export with SLBB domain
LGIPTQTVLHMVSNNLVWIMGQVGNPRAYVAAPGTRLGDMLAVGGGALRDSDLSSVEVTSTVVDPQTGVSHTDRRTFSESNGDFKTVSIQPFDVIRVRPVFTDRQDGNVTVTGAVRYPGTFDIIRGERLSSLLVRAGGLTEQAYPYGAVFTRRSVALAESLGNEREARALNSQLVTLVSSELNQPAAGGSGNGQGAAQFLTNLADQLRNAPVLGRMSIITDPAVLAVNPANDILLEPGDTLFIPVRPSTVTVSGEVLSAGAFRYDPKYSVTDYIRLAGGASQSADEGRIFVVLPDGSAAPRSDSWLSFDSHSVPPGATIVVPRDLSPFNLSQFLVTATQIVSQLALSAASISVVTRDSVVTTTK